MKKQNLSRAGGGIRAAPRFAGRTMTLLRLDAVRRVG
jgi:hypothetical protein